MFKLLSAVQFKCLLHSPQLNTRYEEQVGAGATSAQVYDAVVEYVLVDTEGRRKHLPMLYEEIQWPLIRTPK